MISGARSGTVRGRLDRTDGIPGTPKCRVVGAVGGARVFHLATPRRAPPRSSAPPSRSSSSSRPASLPAFMHLCPPLAPTINPLLSFRHDPQRQFPIWGGAAAAAAAAAALAASAGHFGAIPAPSPPPRSSATASGVF